MINDIAFLVVVVDGTSSHYLTIIISLISCLILEVALAVGALIHLLLDAMWTVQETFLWPAFGWEFPPGLPDYWSGLLERLLADPWRILQEAVGLGYLIYLYRKARLSDPERRSELLHTGRVMA